MSPPPCTSTITRRGGFGAGGFFAALLVMPSARFARGREFKFFFDFL
jgi:hypothetical protein